MAYLKRLAMPKTWPFERKASKFVVRPLPGMELQNSMPIVLIIKHLGFAKTTKEAKFILNSGRIKVNNKIIKKMAFPVGLFDVVSFSGAKKNFRLLFKNKKLFLHEIDENEAKIKPVRIIKKTALKGKKLQINLNDGENILASIDCKVGDTLIIDLEKKKIYHIKLEKGNLAYLLGGKYLGKIVKILEIKERELVCEINSKKINVLKKYIFVIGKEKPIISLPKEK